MDNTFEEYLIKNAKLSPKFTEGLLSNLETKRIKKGDVLLSEGQICEHTFFVEKGLLRMYALNSEGKENIVQFAPEEWLISDRGSVFFNSPSSYTIDAIEDTSYVMITESLIQEISEQSDLFRSYNAKALHNHIRHLQQRITQLLGHSAKERYLDFIQLYPDLTLRIPQWMIASYLGITPESLSRVRKELAKENFKKP